MLRSQRGQSTVELALCLPFVGLLVAFVIQVGIVSVNHGRLWHAAREAARTAAVDADIDAIRAAAERSGLSQLGVTVEPTSGDRAVGAPVTVTVRHAPVASIPIIGRFLDDVTFTAAATMRIETP